MISVQRTPSMHAKLTVRISALYTLFRSRFPHRPFRILGYFPHSAIPYFTGTRPGTGNRSDLFTIFYQHTADAQPPPDNNYDSFMGCYHHCTTCRLSSQDWCPVVSRHSVMLQRSALTAAMRGPKDRVLITHRPTCSACLVCHGRVIDTAVS